MTQLLARRLVLLSSAVCSVALHLSRDAVPAREKDWHTVLILGCSVDRFALSDVHGPPPKRKSKSWRVVHDPMQDTSFLYVFHRGVGFNGDLKPPFYISWNSTEDGTGNYSTQDTITNVATKASKSFLRTENPSVVIVDSSLWDLWTWFYYNRTYDQESRVQRWCDHDLPGLLSLVSATFPSSRIVFRTAPALHPASPRLHAKTGVEEMYKCIQKHTSRGFSVAAGFVHRLFNKYEVLDYHKIVEDLIKDDVRSDALQINMSDIWRSDMYHPGPSASRRYMQAIRALFPQVVGKPFDPRPHEAQKAPDETSLPMVPQVPFGSATSGARQPVQEPVDASFIEPRLENDDDDDIARIEDHVLA